MRRILEGARDGQDNESDRLMSVLYADLRRIVRGVMAGEGHRHALKPAAVANEAFLAVVQSNPGLLCPDSDVHMDWQSRAHFLALAARQMRLVLTDYVRQRRRAKAGFRFTISLDDLFSNGVETIHDFAAFDQLLNALGAADPVSARVLEMYCFSGMTDREIALVQHTSIEKTRHYRQVAQHWLNENMGLPLAETARHKTANESA